MPQDVPVVSDCLQQRIEHAVSWVLNPLSHSQTVDRYRAEIDDAILAVEELEYAVRLAICVSKVGPLALRRVLLDVLNLRTVKMAPTQPPPVPPVPPPDS